MLTRPYVSFEVIVAIYLKLTNPTAFLCVHKVMTFAFLRAKNQKGCIVEPAFITTLNLLQLNNSPCESKPYKHQEL